jgi:outer membrane immunogenic protein
MRIKAAILWGMTLGLGSLQFAAAADLPVRTPVYKAPAVTPYLWSGCYVGAQVGYAWGRDRLTEIDQTTGTVSIFSPGDVGDPSGVKLGGMVGCNWQWTGNWVAGIEGDGEWADVSGGIVEFPNSGTPADTFETQIKWQASLRARFGYAFDRTLLYVTGGAALADVRHIYASPAVGVSQDFTNAQVGWTVGGGLEHAISPQWTVRVEYRYSDFGTITNVPNLPAAAWVAFTEHHDVTEHALRLGVAHKFSSGPMR